MRSASADKLIRTNSGCVANPFFAKRRWWFRHGPGPTTKNRFIARRWALLLDYDFLRAVRLGEYVVVCLVAFSGAKYGLIRQMIGGTPRRKTAKQRQYEHK